MFTPDVGVYVRILLKGILRMQNTSLEDKKMGHLLPQ